MGKMNPEIRKELGDASGIKLTIMVGPGTN